jgi:hypothetical protein
VRRLGKLMSDFTDGLLVMTVGGLFVGTVGSALAILWSRTVRGAWPDKDTIIVLVKLFYGIGLFGIAIFLWLKYA